MGVIFCQAGLENSLYKNKEYEFQTKKMIPIVVSTISLQLSGSLYLYPYFSWYIPPIHKQFFVGAINFVSYLVAKGWENFKFLRDLLYWGDLISFLGERTIFFHRAINAQSCKLKNS